MSFEVATTSAARTYERIAEGRRVFSGWGKILSTEYCIHFQYSIHTWRDTEGVTMVTM